jgi:hypothetical protein
MWDLFDMLNYIIELYIIETQSFNTNTVTSDPTLGQFNSVPIRQILFR